MPDTIQPPVKHDVFLGVQDNSEPSSATVHFKEILQEAFSMDDQLSSPQHTFKRRQWQQKTKKTVILVQKTFPFEKDVTFTFEKRI